MIEKLEKLTIMKKYMKYICAVLLVIGTIAHAWADVTVTFDPTSDVGSSATSITKQGVTISFPDLGGGVLNNETEYKWYSKKLMHFSCSAKIKRVVFTAASGYSTSTISVNTGGGSISSGTWANATGATLVIFANTEQIRLSEIQVTIESTTCDLKVYNGSTYITWRSIEQTDALPVR